MIPLEVRLNRWLQDDVLDVTCREGSHINLTVWVGSLIHVERRHIVLDDVVVCGDRFSKSLRKLNCVLVHSWNILQA